MTILVTGATGLVGRHVVGQLVQAGESVRALTRDQAKARLPEGVEVCQGDLLDPASAVPALEGVRKLFLSRSRKPPPRSSTSRSRRARGASSCCPPLP
ncbi:NAD(P)H-binding protein [Kibdelosporangium philippinense]|uniref:NAD(P)H-binding protein n=1 Tax=Kibdelosporangium philippinense TaxID=211113 RepID=A0ABS8Z354_9PSEU|nr:NAD(P)H-binding protein [Kibdelosporangium philippinense]MCE7002270.1 NAD(P)H-binding protein [Kibdelosporangium philippinense]